MDFYLDDSKTEVTATEDAALGELIKEIKARLSASGRILVGIQCDGIDVTGGGFGEALTKPVGTHRRIDLQSADPRKLVVEALRTAGEVLDSAGQASAEIVDLLSQGDIEKAMPKLGECCQAWAQVHEGVCNSIAMLGIDADTFKVEGRTLPELMAAPCEHLQQIKEVIVAKDFVLLADILNYEFPEAVMSWRKIIDALSPAAPTSIR